MQKMQIYRGEVQRVSKRGGALIFPPSDELGRWVRITTYPGIILPGDKVDFTLPDRRVRIGKFAIARASYVNTRGKHPPQPGAS